MEIEREKEREPVLVPMRRRESIPEKKFPESSPEQPEVEVQEIPRRWYVY